LSTTDLYNAAPLISLCSLILVVMLIESLVKESENASFWISAFGLILCAVVSISTIGMSGSAFNDMLTVGGYASLFATLFIVSALLTILLSREYLRRQHSHIGEYYLLLLFATLGMMLMAAAADLIIIFLGLELMSVSLYVLAGFNRKRSISNESSLKYFLLGAFATGFLLYGIAFIYGAAGTTNIAAVIGQFPRMSASHFFWIGLGLLMVGFAFKVGAVPFHMWIPDVYQGSPTTVSGFMSTGAKAAGFSAFVLVFAHPELGASPQLRTVLAVLSAASMILGNIVAVAQSNIKRMLAYSSIAHAGYMIIGLAAFNQLGRDGILFYLVAYTFMNLGAFGILSVLEVEEDRNLTFDDYAGLATKRPVLAALMAVFMLSLAGIPPLAGFFGKYYLFVAAVQSNLTWLAIVGVLTSVVSAYYYLRLIMVMYFRPEAGSEALSPSGLCLGTLAIAALMVIALGIYPSSILAIISSLH
jgi:NADH-quinone oxidoreductase subunit N